MIEDKHEAQFLFCSHFSTDGSKTALRHRIQLGMAKKIQNGARKLVLEQAEAARVAAFSALRALGVDVPAALSQPLIDNIALVRKELEGQEVPLNVDKIDSKINMQYEDRPKLHIISENRNSHMGQETCAHRDEFRPVTLHANSVKACNELGDQILACGNDGLSQGPVDIDSLIGGFDEFLTLWQEKTEFFFDLHFNLTSKETGSPVFDVKGIAICWVGSPIYYVSLEDISTTKKMKDEDTTCCTVAKHRWKNIGIMLGAEGVLKVTWNWKNQVLAFKFPSISVGAPRQMAQLSADTLELGSANRRLPEVSATDGVVDLHIAAWLLWPDEESAQNFSLEQVVLSLRTLYIGVWVV